MPKTEEAFTGCATGDRSASNHTTSAEENRCLDLALERASPQQVLRTFAGGLAHTFNNLLTVIISNAAMAQEEVPPESPARDQLHRIMATAHHASEVTKQMLRFAQSYQLVLERLDLSKLILELDDCFRAVAGDRVFIEYELSPYLPETLVDREQLRRLMTNLVLNASEAIGNDVGVIHIKAAAVHANKAMLSSQELDRAVPEGRCVWLQVADTGCGMDEDTRRHLFEPFFSTKFIGRGLGLSEALGIVNRHRGAIWATSEQGQGSVFNVLLPCETTEVKSISDRLHADALFFGPPHPKG